MIRDLAPFPHSAETERAVLGAILLNNELMEEMAGDGPELFYLERNITLFLAYQTLRHAGLPIDMRTVQAHLGEDFDAVGGIAYLAQLDLDLPDIGRIDQYLEILRNLQAKRQLMALGLRIAAEAASRDAGDARVLAETFAQEAGLVAASRAPGGLISMGEVLEAAAARIGAGAEAVEVWPTGFYDLDRLLGGGLSPGSLVFIAGRPGMGKTTFATEIAKYLASKLVPTGYFSAEMEAIELGLRIMSGEVREKFSELKAGRIPDYKRWMPAAFAAEMRGYPLSINDRGGQSVGSILSESKKKKLKVSIADYLQILTGDGRAVQNRDVELGGWTRRLKQGAKDQGMCAVALSQLNRQVENRADHRPQLSDLRESGSIEADADVVIFLYRDEVYDQFSESKGLCEVIVAKNRNGETGRVVLAWDGMYTRFHNLELRREPPPLR